MPSSITLTVSHLPTSTSFFLSALQPLQYGYRGRADQTVGFGPINSSAPADFWITQECPGVPAGAAHVAFPAPSRQAVQDFFHVALKAGASIHGEPCTRDAHGYYSAAVIDFDGNSIEAVHRPGSGDDNKENDASTFVSNRSSSRAPSMVSRAPSSASKALTIAPTSVSKARSAAPTVSANSESTPKTQGDALETLLNQARSTADVARKLVEQVRPHLPTSNSAPSVPAPSKQHVHNPDAFAKSGDGGNAVFGTLLGVAAGAALTYAFTNSRKGSPDNSEDGAKSRGRRPSVAGRSATAPAHQLPQYRALEGHPSHHISLQDNDYASTIRPSPSRRGSADSGIGISPPSTTSRSSRKPGPRMIEAPPTSYKAPTVITQAQTAVTGQQHPHSRSSRSKTRHADIPETASHSSSKHRRSRSESRSRHHTRHDSGISTTGSSSYETVLHVTTQRSYGPSDKNDAHHPHHHHRKDGSPPSARWAANKHFPLPNESVSSTRPPAAKQHSDKSKAAPPAAASTMKTRSPSRSGRSRASTVRPPAEYPLPPSRAATWAAGGAGGPRSSSNSKAESFVTASRSRRGGGEDGTKTVIGKMREVDGLRVKAGEVRPEDSVSQVSSVRSGRR